MLDQQTRTARFSGPRTRTKYIYDANGRRVRKTTGSNGSVDFLYDLSGNEITELSSTGAWNRGEVYAGGRHLATYTGGTNGTTYFHHADWLGTERARTTNTGAVYETCTSLPFGDWLTCSASDVSPMHFTGQEHDSESNLDFFIARHNSPSFGRFLSPDPENADASPNSPQSWNAYSYVLNNPLIYADPSGLDCVYQNDSDHTQVWIKPGDCKSETDNGYYVDGRIVGAFYNHWTDAAYSGITFDQDNNWMSYSFHPYDAPFMTMAQAQCVGDCPNDAAIASASSGRGGPVMRATTRSSLLTPPDTYPPPKRSIFNPAPSCPALFLSSWAEDATGDASLHLGAAALEPAAKATAQAAVTNHIVKRGLVTPLRSSIVRRFLFLGETSSNVLFWGPILKSEVSAFGTEAKAWSSGDCRTIWSSAGVK